MSRLGEARRILRVYRISPRKRLGQNFLVDDATLRKIVSFASLSREDIVLEVGAGLGFLTEYLADKAKEVIAVEIDPNLVEVMKARLSNYDNLRVLQGDIFELAIPCFDKVVSTPPYFISSTLLFWLLGRKFEHGVLTFQEEFARRLVAPVGSEDYGRLTVSTYYRAQIELLSPISRDLFWPSPKVDSMIVRLRPRNPPFPVENEEIFFDVARAIFTQKNRKLRNALLPFFRGFRMARKEVLQLVDTLPFCDKRSRELSPEEIGLLADVILRRLKKSDYFGNSDSFPDEYRR